MWNGKYKAVTFSYDDGVVQDIRLVRLMNQYGVKCTFNLNSGIMTRANHWNNNGVEIYRMNMEEMRGLYDGHEIAVHTLTHPDLTQLDPATIRNEVLEDKHNLERMFGCEVVGMAYPYGTYNDQVVEILRDCGIRYSRTVWGTGAYGMPAPELLMYRPTAHHNDQGLMDLVRQFVDEEPDPANPKLLYIWGHSYEFDVDHTWEKMEDLLRLVSWRDDIFYGTNKEVLLDR